METIEQDGITISIGSHEGKTIVLGADHRGFELKKAIKEHLEKKGFIVVDVGTDSSDRTDYPKFSDEIGKKVAENPNQTAGIGICGSGIGILIPASKHKGVYVARCTSAQEAETSRKHNNSNVLGLGADCTDKEAAIKTVDAWLNTKFYESENDAAYLNRYIQTVKLE